MRQRFKRLRGKLPRVKKIIHKTYDVSAEHALFLTYWGMITIMLYAHVLNLCQRGSPPSPLPGIYLSARGILHVAGLAPFRYR
jgi:hypothetical protein